MTEWKDIESAPKGARWDNQADDGDESPQGRYYHLVRESDGALVAEIYWRGEGYFWHHKGTDWREGGNPSFEAAVTALLHHVEKHGLSRYDD